MNKHNPTNQNEPTVSSKTDDAPSSQTNTKTEEKETAKIASRRKSIGCLIWSLVAGFIAIFFVYQAYREAMRPHVDHGPHMPPLTQPKDLDNRPVTW